MRKLFGMLIFLGVAVIPAIAFAASPDFLEWKTSLNDKSIYYLGLVFGQVGTVLYGDGNQLFGSLFKIYNTIVLTLGAVVVTYSVVMSTISTAHEGEVLGKKWSSVWIPFKAAAGLSFLVPLGTGYSMVQILMMWIILQGVHGANQIWYLVIDTLKSGASLTSGFKIEKSQTKDTAIGLFQAAICMNKLNNSEEALELFDGQFVDVYRSPYKIDELWIGIDSLTSPYQSVCGVVKAAPKHPNAVNNNEWIQRQLDGAEMGIIAVDQYAEEAALNPRNPIEWSGISIIPQAMRAIQGQVTNVQVQRVALPAPIRRMLEMMGLAPNQDALLNLARQDGWIHAGAYYHKLVQSGLDLTFYPPTFTKPGNYPFDVADQNGWDFDIIPTSFRYLKVSEIGFGGGNQADLVTEPANLSKKAKQAMGKSVSGFTAMARGFMNHLSNRDADPIISFQKFGTEVMLATEIIFWVLVVVLPIIMAVACIYNIMQPACYVVGVIVVILMPVLITMLALLWSAGVATGLYLPLVPYLVYTLTCAGWLIFCIEALVAAPIVALGLASPGQDYLGKASPAVLLITGIFLRPALIVIGFIAAARVVQPVIGMVNFGFEAFTYQGVGALLLFGNIALIVVYAGIAITAIHAVFALVHIIPDKVIRWIGGQVEDSGVERAMQQIEQYSEKAAQATGGVMKGAAEGALSGAKQALSASSKAKDKDLAAAKNEGQSAIDQALLSLGGDSTAEERNQLADSIEHLRDTMAGDNSRDRRGHASRDRMRRDIREEIQELQDLSSRLKGGRGGDDND